MFFKHGVLYLIHRKVKSHATYQELVEGATVQMPYEAFLNNRDNGATET